MKSLSALVVLWALQGGPPRKVEGPIVYVVAPGQSPAAEARRMLRLCRWNDTTLVKDADAVLVVVRSSSGQPMAPAYDNLKWLRDEASSQLNETGAQFHVYLYSIRPDLSFLQTTHRSYDAHGSGRLSDPGGPLGWARRCG